MVVQKKYFLFTLVIKGLDHLSQSILYNWIKHKHNTLWLHELPWVGNLDLGHLHSTYKTRKKIKYCFFFLHHLLLFIFTSKSPQNDIFRSNFGSKFGQSWRSLRFTALRCCSYKVHYVNMVYGSKCCLKFWYNSCIFSENGFNGRSDRTENRLGRVFFFGHCHLTFIWEQQKILSSFFYSSE